MKTNTLQNKLKKMQLFFKKSLLFEKIIISLHSDKKSSSLLYSCHRIVRTFNESKNLNSNTRKSASLLIWINGNSHNLDDG